MLIAWPFPDNRVTGKPANISVTIGIIVSRKTCPVNSFFH